jgi:tetratricopeptide (TPR) repeat protein
MPAVRHLAAFALIGFGALAVAQSPSAPASNPCPPAQTQSASAPCTPPSDLPAAERFPFPEETPAQATPPSAPTQQPSVQPSANKFPFPEEPATPAADSSSSSSSSSDAPDPEEPKLIDKGSHGNITPARQQSAEDRIAEDLDVANFYRNRGNYMAAYLRIKDALSYQPDDAEINYSLAEDAQKLGKKDEAVEHYKAYLKLAPQGPKSKTAQKALQQLVPPTK